MPNTTITSALTELGLGENEAMLYEILIKYPNATIPLLTKQTKLSRTMLYYVLKRLTEFALITTNKKDNKTVYEAVSPDRLEEIVHEQQKELDRQKSALGTIMSDLRSTYNLSHNKPGVRFFEGEEGIKQVLWDSLTAKDITYTIGDLQSFIEAAGNVNVEYLKKRKKLGIQKKAITNDSDFNRNFLRNYDTELTDTRLITSLPANFHHTILEMYDNKISYTTFSQGSLIGIIIESEAIYNMHRQIFELLWPQAKKLEELIPSKTTP